MRNGQPPPQLRAALQRHGQPKTGRKAELLSRWKEFKERGQEQQGLLQQCEQLLPDILAKVDVDRFTYRQLLEDMERKLDLEPQSLESIRPQLKAAVTSYMSRKQGGPQKVYHSVGPAQSGWHSSHLYMGLLDKSREGLCLGCG